jgi:Enoyl-(Acyl carrier protein) reductase
MPDGVHITALCPRHDHGAAKEKVGDWDALMQGVFAAAPITAEAQVLVNLGLVHRDSEWHPLWEGCALLVGGGLAVTFGEHLLQPPALIFQWLGLRDRRRIHPALLRAPPEKRRLAHTMFTAKFRDRHATLGLAQDRKDLGFAVSGHPHLNPLMHLAEKYLFPQPPTFGRDYPMARNLASELAPYNIRSNVVAPAVVETAVYNTVLSDEQVKAILPTFNAFHPLGRNGQPGDVAKAILFFASEQSSSNTGTILSVDGGVTAGRV